MICCCGLTTIFVLKFLMRILSYCNDPPKILNRLNIYTLSNGRPAEDSDFIAHLQALFHTKKWFSACGLLGRASALCVVGGVAKSSRRKTLDAEGASLGFFGPS